MSNSKYAVAFDTNSYRQFVRGKTTQQVIKAIEELRASEERKNIKAFGVVIVGMEMLGNLVEGEEGMNYKDCLNGVIALAYHCYDINQSAPRIIPQPYLHLCHSFFGVIPQHIEEQVKNMGGAFNDFKIDVTKALEHHKKVNSFEKIKSYLHNEEEKFANQIIGLIEGAKQEILRSHPQIGEKHLRIKLLDFIKSDSFEKFLAMAIMYAVAATLNIHLPEDKIANLAHEMRLNFPVSVGFYKWICHKIVSDNIDMRSKKSRDKRWNWQWDYQVSFVISNSTLEKREMILVTSDEDIIEMLSDHGYQDKVLTISKYLDYLK